jgi:hypothetical protein
VGKLKKEKGYLRLDGISSKDILALLGERHANDVIVPECKNGETWGARDLLKLDVWVLRRTYSPLTTIGYEIKVNRQDFEHDKKWENYLDVCHEFYFVCPAGLIRTTDLPARVGIIWASKDRLFTKRKAQRVEPSLEKLSNLLIYVVMARSQIVASMYDRDTPQLSNLEQKRKWVEDADAKGELAFFVRGHVQKVYERIMGLELSFKQREGHIETFRRSLEQLGIIWNPESSAWDESFKVQEAIRQLRKVVDLRLIRQMQQLAETLVSTGNTLEEIIKDTEDE